MTLKERFNKYFPLLCELAIASSVYNLWGFEAVVIVVLGGYQIKAWLRDILPKSVTINITPQ